MRELLDFEFTEQEKALMHMLNMKRQEILDRSLRVASEEQAETAMREQVEIVCEIGEFLRCVMSRIEGGSREGIRHDC